MGGRLGLCPRFKGDEYGNPVLASFDLPRSDPHLAHAAYQAHPQDLHTDPEDHLVASRLYLVRSRPSARENQNRQCAVATVRRQRFQAL